MTRAIYPGTFDPIHLGHVDIAARSARIFDELIVGVYDRPAKNLMFTAEERISLARVALKDIPDVQVMAYRPDGQLCSRGRCSRHRAWAAGDQRL